MEQKNFFKSKYIECDLIKNFNKFTNNKYNFFRIKNVEFVKRENKLIFNLIYHVKFEQILKKDKDVIINNFIELINSSFHKEIIFTKYIPDIQLIKINLFKFLQKFKIFSAFLNENDIDVVEEKNEININIFLPETLINYFIEENIYNEINIFLVHNYCIDYVMILNAKNNEDLNNLQLERNIIIEENNNDRKIIPKNVIKFIGKKILDSAIYIEDVISDSEDVILCGKIIDINKCCYKKEDQEKYFYKFKLDDTTGVMNCVYFPTKLTENIIINLTKNNEIICAGKIKTWNDNVSLQVKNISYAEFPKDFNKNIIKTIPNSIYKYVQPTKYNNIIIDTFENIYQPPEALLNEKYCVFDCETTGLESYKDKIIEIGACKIINGYIKEIFSTFVNPKIKLSQQIIDLTKIQDEHLINAPSIEEVIPDFYKFCYDCILVGHNIEFDCSFIEKASKPLKIFFNNKKIDTLNLAKQHLKLNNNKLSTVAKHFGIINEGEHRAIYDALTTAKIFIKFNLLNKKELIG